MPPGRRRWRVASSFLLLLLPVDGDPWLSTLLENIVEMAEEAGVLDHADVADAAAELPIDTIDHCPPDMFLLEGKCVDDFSRRRSSPSPTFGQNVPPSLDMSHAARAALALTQDYLQQGGRWVYHNVLLYQPPVGIVAVWKISQLVLGDRRSSRGRSSRSGERGSSPTDGDDVTSEQAAKAFRLDRHSGRALDLDGDDMDYQQFGGIERVRRRLLSKALEGSIEEIVMLQRQQNQGQKEDGISKSTSSTNPKAATTKTSTTKTTTDIGTVKQLLKGLQDMMQVTFSPGSSHSDYVQRLLLPMTKAEQAMVVVLKNTKMQQQMQPQVQRLVSVAYQTAELRALDGLLRLTRDRLLRSSFRLSRTMKYWHRRVEAQKTASFLPVVRQLMAGAVEGDRMRLAFAQSAYQTELKRLGKIVSLLADRPAGLNDVYLQSAVQNTLGRPTLTESGPKPRATVSSMLRQGKIPKFKPSNFSLRFNVDGRGKFSLHRYEESLTIGVGAARQVLLEDCARDNDSWSKESKVWCQEARAALYDCLSETVQTSVQTTERQEEELQKLRTPWVLKQYGEESPDVEHCWRQIFLMVREMHQLRRLGDGKSVKWRDANLIHWFRQWDLLGIPSTLLYIWIARYIHFWILPHWPEIKALLFNTYAAGNEFVETRFLVPIRDLLQELMNRPTSQLLTGISAADEELSLDNMLRDLSFGDGTSAGRQKAIIKASRQYESDMDTGLVRHALGGRLIRLMLVQVQQLKVGMLHAAETVDVLLQANRLNIQILTIIPAVVILTFAFKFLYKAMFTVRVKNLRTMGSVHGEMTEYLVKIETLLLLAKNRDGTGSSSSRNKSSRLASSPMLNDRELGEFVLSLYDYLVLLDYSSPQPFPNRQGDDIHSSITRFLGPNGSLRHLTVNQQLRLIDQVKVKHLALEKFL